MREIKFRAWCDACNAFVPIMQVFPGDTGLSMYCPMHPPVELTVLMQYTGLKDKNGVEIYEGDIVIWLLNTVPKVVRYCQNEAAFVADTPSGKPDSCLDSGCKVIGNIHEHPELMEGS